MLIVAVVFDFVPGGFERIKGEILDVGQDTRSVQTWTDHAAGVNR